MIFKFSIISSEKLEWDNETNGVRWNDDDRKGGMETAKENRWNTHTHRGRAKAES